MKRSLARAALSALRAARARIAWCMVGTAVYQVGFTSSSHWKNFSALKPGVQTTDAPAESEESTAAIRPWMWNSGMMLRQRSAVREPQRRADVRRRGGEIGLRQRHDFWARRRAGGVQHERDVVGHGRARHAGLADRLARDAEGAGRRVVVRLDAEDRDAEPLGHRFRRRIAVRVDQQRLGPEVGEIELEFFRPVGGIERRGRGAARRSTRRRPPSPARSAGRWRRGRCGRCRARSAGRRYRSPDPAARRR